MTKFRAIVLSLEVNYKPELPIAESYIFYQRVEKSGLFHTDLVLGG